MRSGAVDSSPNLGQGHCGPQPMADRTAPAKPHFLVSGHADHVDGPGESLGLDARDDVPQVDHCVEERLVFDGLQVEWLALVGGGEMTAQCHDVIGHGVRRNAPFDGGGQPSTRPGPP